ncbi:hypothetical protein SJI19_13490 [Acerihabitans sp. TG2]|uniref:hypothetical protein n=1 Tax=Acerihabitans sp. TG2 TaxID=3096008 RepID=UPI002B23ABE5|nr:hypothetical protein [Acerihabitans sp. TG2]MEA9391543.1 hypothetical protein [Acerihabitans sp. TG2]
MRILPPMLILLVATLSGCASSMSDCDPTTGDVSIVSKFNCRYSGTYDQRVNVKQQTLTHEQALNHEFKAVLAAIEQEKNQSNSSLKSRQASADQLNRSMNTLLTQLKQKAAGQKKYQKQINDLQTSLDQAQQQQPSQSVLDKQLQLEDLRSQVSSLQQDLELN